jgi:uncharacterized membrane protein (DUF441 family)
VQIAKGVDDLYCPVKYHAFVQLLAARVAGLEQLPQIVAGHKVHYQVVAAVVGEEVRHLGQIGVVQLGEDAGLLQKLLVGLLAQLIRQVRIGQHFLQRAHTPR